MSQIPRPQVMNETNAKSGSFTGYFRLTGIFSKSPWWVIPFITYHL